MDTANYIALGVVVVLVAFVGFLAERRRPSFGSTDTEAIRDAIARQIGAFLTDNASVAFAHAAPRIQHKYRNGQAFLEAVSKAYLPIYRPLAYRFGELVKSHTGPTQMVHVTGPHGKDWIVSCFMEKQPDTAWKIAGFHVRRAPERDAVAAEAA